MKILQVDNIACVDINTISKFNLIDAMLLSGIKECIESAPHFPQTPMEYLKFLYEQIKNQNQSFKLIVGIKDGKVVFFCALFIVTDDGSPACFINSLYSDPGLTIPIADKLIKYIDEFAISRSCTKMLFHTAKNKKAFYRLSRKYGWKPKPVVIFERSLAL